MINTYYIKLNYSKLLISLILITLNIWSWIERSSKVRWNWKKVKCLTSNVICQSRKFFEKKKKFQRFYVHSCEDGREKIWGKKCVCVWPNSLFFSTIFDRLSLSLLQTHTHTHRSHTDFSENLPLKKTAFLFNWRI